MAVGETLTQPVSGGATLRIPDAARPFGEVYGCTYGPDVIREVYIGMPESEITCQVGEADTVNRGMYGNRATAQYVFSGRDTDTWYLYTTNGFVTSWQESWTR